MQPHYKPILKSSDNFSVFIHVSQQLIPVFCVHGSKISSGESRLADGSVTEPTLAVH